MSVRMMVIAVAVVATQFVGLIHIIRERRLATQGSAGPSDIVVTPERIDLGTVPLGSRHTMRSRVKNVSDRPIELVCDRDCKCLKASLRPSQIAPREVATAIFEYDAPSVPQLIDRHVRLLTKAGQIVADISVAGTADGDTWAYPDAVAVQLDAQGEGHSVVEVRTKTRKRITGLICRASSVTSVKRELSSDDDDEGARRAIFDVYVSSRAEGKDELRAVDSGANEMLLIPILWKSKPRFVCRPKALAIPAPTGSSSSLDWTPTLIISLDTGDIQRLDAYALVDWCRVARFRRKGTRMIAIDLVLDPKRMPAEFDGAMVRVGIRDVLSSYIDVFAETD